jgi:hypothetical protein
MENFEIAKSNEVVYHHTYYSKTAIHCRILHTVETRDKIALTCMWIMGLSKTK